MHKNPRRFVSDSKATEIQRSILVVESNRTDLVQMASLLRSMGYLVAEASGFEEANQILASDPPHLLIAGVKLGAYNGLHLIVRAHAKHPEMASIVTSNVPDPVLEAEAQKQHASYLTRPWHDQDFLQAITRSLERDVTQPVHARPSRPDGPSLLFSCS
jgi:DNA-binding NtrC family response regulator